MSKPSSVETAVGHVVPLSAGALVTARRTPPAVLTSTPDPVGLLMALRRCWWLAGGVALLGGALVATGMWFLQKSTFTARTLVHIQSTLPNPIRNGGDGGGNFSNYQRNQIALVKSRLVLNKALQNPKVSALPLWRELVDPVLWLEAQIRADFSIAFEIFRISMNGEDPSALITILDAVREAYLKEIIFKERNQQMDQLKRVNESLAEVEKRLEGRRSYLQDVANLVGSKDPDELRNLQELHLKQQDQTLSLLLKVKQELLVRGVQDAFAAKKDGPPLEVPIPKELMETALENEPELARLTNQASSLTKEIKHIELYENDPAKHPKYAKMKEQLDGIEKGIPSVREKLRPIVAKKIQDRYRLDIQKTSVDVRREIEHFENEEKYLTDLYVSQTKTLKDFQVKKVDVETVRESIKIEEVARDRFLSSKLEWELLILHALERASMLEEATAAPDTDSRIKKSAMAGAGVFALLFFGITLLEFRKRRVNNVDEVVRGLDLRLMGTLPVIPSRSRRGLANSGQPRDQYWQQAFAESVDSARTMLQHMAQLESCKVVMITSAVGGEGKTMLSCHLAISLARAGYKTLLIDCDLRNAAVHKVFDMNAEPGFGDLLSGELEMAAAMQAGPLENLFVVAAGNCGPEALQALAQHKSTDVFNQLKDQFDFVLVDSAPILPVADTLLLAPCVDAVILSVLRDVSRLPSVYAAYEKLASLRVHILGAVVAGTSGDHYRPRYPYQSAAGSSPASRDE